MSESPHGDQAGRVCVVTGASSGIGAEVARNLAGLGATVVLACRNEIRAGIVRDGIMLDTGNPRVTVMPVDMASQSSIHGFARRLLGTYPRIHVLINNAAVCLFERRISEDGIEATWATNVLGYHLLARLLLDRLKVSAPARIVNVASTYAGGLDLVDPEFRGRRYHGVTAYRQSKQADRMLTWALAARLEGTGVTANAAHPGGVATAIYRDFRGCLGALTRAWVRVTKAGPGEGADTPTWLAASPEVGGRSGMFWASRRELPCAFRDPADVEQLWVLCEQMVARGPAARPSPGAGAGW